MSYQVANENHRGFRIADFGDRVQRSELEIGKMTRVNVTSIVSPIQIFLQKMDSDFGKNLKVVENLDLCYATLKNPRTLKRPVEVNSLCVVKHEGRFYRALTVAFEQGTTKVMFADFGGVKAYGNDELLMIASEFVEQPLLAIECIVDAVMVSYNGGPFEQSMSFSMDLFVTGEHHVVPQFEDESGLTHVHLYVSISNFYVHPFVMQG